MVDAPAPRQVKRSEARGGAKKSKAETVALLGKGFGGGFWLLSLKLGDHWQLEDEQKRELAEKLAAALATLPKGNVPPWLAEFMRMAESCAPWIAFATALGTVALPRVMVTKMNAEAEREAKAAEDAPAGAGVVGGITPNGAVAYGS